MISSVAIAAGFTLILIGLYGALTNRNMLRMIVAFTVANTGQPGACSHRPHVRAHRTDPGLHGFRCRGPRTNN